MIIHPNNMIVEDFCAAYDQRKIVVNPDYQRSNKVWPPAAKSYLIETIVLGLPVPKFYLFQTSDPKSGKSYKEIVDGQQRTKALLSYFGDEFRLSRKLETQSIAGKKYSELDPEDQDRFKTCSLSIDLFVSASREDVRDVFRRMNSYTIPLNAEEHRHATYQGECKWLINRIARRFSQPFVAMGVFREKQLSRMADAKLLTELCHAAVNGLQTTRQKELDALYKSRDEEFPEAGWLEPALTGAIDQVISLSDIHHTALMKPHVVYAIILALMHLTNRIEGLNDAFPIDKPIPIKLKMAIANLLALSEALEDPDNAGELEPFVAASATKTNVRDQRIERFRWACKALTARSL